MRHHHHIKDGYDNYNCKNVRSNTNVACISNLSLFAAYEYIFRKNYVNPQDWAQELNERYGFWTFEKAIQLVNQAGFEIEFAKQIKNDWIIDNRLKGQVDIFDFNTGKRIDYPMYQLVIIAKKKF